MYWWEITTTSGRTFAVKGGSSFDYWCSAIRMTARMAAREMLNDGEEICAWFRKEPYSAYPLPPEYRVKRYVQDF